VGLLLFRNVMRLGLLLVLVLVLPRPPAFRRWLIHERLARAFT
jgi:hypothetical protein